MFTDLYNNVCQVTQDLNIISTCKCNDALLEFIRKQKENVQQLIQCSNYSVAARILHFQTEMKNKIQN